MIRPALILLPAATLFIFAACESDQDVRPHPKEHHQFGYGGDTQTETAPPDDNAGATQPSTPDTGVDTGGPVAPPPPPPPSVANQSNGPTPPAAGDGGGTVQKKDYPYAQPVPGKQGFVTSPYAPYSGYVDVRGFPPGTEVKDPYTQKVFLVP